MQTAQEVLATPDIANLSTLTDNLPDYGPGIKTDEQLEEAIAALTENKAIQKRLDDERTAAKAPYLEGGRVIDDHFKGLAEPLKTAEQALKSAIGEYQRKQRIAEERKAAEAEERARKEREALARRAAKAEESGKVEKAEALEQQASETVAAAPARSKPKGIATVASYSYEIVDASKINPLFMSPDHKKIAAQVKSMKEDAEGIVGGIKVTKTENVRTTGR